MESNGCPAYQKKNCGRIAASAEFSLQTNAENVSYHIQTPFERDGCVLGLLRCSCSILLITVSDNSKISRSTPSGYGANLFPIQVCHVVVQTENIELLQYREINIMDYISLVSYGLWQSQSGVIRMHD